MENRQLNVPAPLVWGKFAGYTVNRKLGGPYNRPGCFGEKKTSCPRRHWDQAIKYKEARNWIVGRALNDDWLGYQVWRPNDWC
jgi:hypothetical protein